MFTGIVSDVGEVVEMTRHGDIARLVDRLPLRRAGVALGASVANAGVCLTVVGALRPREAARGSPSTSARRRSAVTTLGELAAGRRINLERPLRIGDELGGHLVSGHVDGLAEIVARARLRGHGAVPLPRAGRALPVHRRPRARSRSTERR